jgi:predicted transcriptional regulator
MAQSKYSKPDDMSEDEYLETINQIISNEEFKKNKELLEKRIELDKVKQQLKEIIDDDN